MQGKNAKSENCNLYITKYSFFTFFCQKIWRYEKKAVTLQRNSK